MTKVVKDTNAAHKAISGTKTKAEQTAALAKAATKPKGGKPGQAMANQSVGYTEEPDTNARLNGDKITNIANAKGTGGVVMTELGANGKGNESMKGQVVLPSTVSAELRKLAVVGGSLKAVRAYMAEHKPAAKLAEGVTARLAPNAARASEQSQRANRVAAHKGAEAKPTKAPVQSKAEAEAKTKAPPAPRAAGDRAYKATDKADNSKAGSFRTYMIGTIRAHKSTELAKAAHTASGLFAKERLNFKWAHDNGYIVLL